MKKSILLFACLCLPGSLMAYSFLSHQLSGAESEQRVLGQLEAKKGFFSFGESEEQSQQVEEAPFTKAVIEEAEGFLAAKEYNRALAMLSNLPIEPQARGDEAYLLKEKRSYLSIALKSILGQAEQSINQARQYFRQYQGGPHHPHVYYHFALNLSRIGKPLEDTRLVKPEFLEPLPPSQAEPLRDLLVEDSMNRGEFFGALRFLEDKKGRLAEGYEKWIREIIEQIENLDDLEDVIDRYDNRDVQALAHLRSIRLLVAQRKNEEAMDYLSDLLGRDDLNPKTYAELQALSGFINNNQEVEPYRIGVILPLSHPRFGRLAREVLDGLEIALRKHRMPGRPFELVIKDSGVEKKSKRKGKKRIKARTEKTKDLVRELAIEDKVVAILGPLARETSIAAGQAAEKYKIPVISLSLTEEIGQGMHYLYRYHKSALREAELLAIYSMDYLQARRFAIFYPTTTSGYKKMKAFKEAVESRGGTLVGLAQVKHRQMDFQDAFLAMTGGFQPLSSEEAEEMSQLRGKPDPIVDIDAIYTPFEPDRLNVIESFSNLFNINDAWILADNRANQRELRLLEQPSRLRYTDSYPIDGGSGFLKSFYDTHWKLFNFRHRYRTPTDYSIHGYESLEILSNLLLVPENQTRESLNRALRETKELPVLTGKVTAEGGGELAKDLKIFYLKNRVSRPLF